MTADPSHVARGSAPVSRRRLLTGGVVALGGALTAGAAVAIAGRDRTPAEPRLVAEFGTATEPFYGPRQSGVATHPQAYASFVAFTLAPT